MKNKREIQNLQLKNLIVKLRELSREKNVKLWRAVAINLEKPRRIRRKVNIAKIEKHCKAGETALIPGKVLSLGELKKDVKVSAYQFSEKAKEKLKGSMSIEELMKNNPEGKKVRLMG
ncbi:50S ribosomal protein L18e [archaeon]|nr:50S ribosomal protein L18e [archaeon]|tara:strand:- start:2928 stop:3281 length:354 start_codon:yes stop_codon:yes gene_type:complete